MKKVITITQERFNKVMSEIIADLNNVTPEQEHKQKVRNRRYLEKVCFESCKREGILYEPNRQG